MMYFINSQITSGVSVSALVKRIPLILNVKAERKEMPHTVYLSQLLVQVLKSNIEVSTIT